MEPKLTVGEYESVMIQTLRFYLTARGWEIYSVGKIQVEEIRLNASEPNHMLEILFRDDARPECLFGWRYPATDSEAPDDPEAITSSGPAQAEFAAEAFVITSFVEQIEALGYGLPAECDPGGLTWIGRY